MPQSPWRALMDGQVSRIHIRQADGTGDRVVFETDQAVAEAPNWTKDGRHLVFNQDGELYRLPVAGGAPELVDSGLRSAYNNDHVLDPDGEHVFATAEDGHIYRFPLAGGPARRVTREDDGLMAHYLHGVSPDGQVLAHIGGAARHNTAVYGIYLFNLATGQTTQLSSWDRPHDGSEFSPDGQWLYFNAEPEGSAPGHAQLYRVALAGGEPVKLTADQRVNWFPHLSPDGSKMVYISFPPGTLGHPENKPVQIVVADPLARAEADRFDLFGGQGSLNVNPWAPGSDAYAYVDYPVAQ